MDGLRAVIRVSILWVMSLAVALAVLEAGHRIATSADQGRLAAPTATVARSVEPRCER